MSKRVVITGIGLVTPKADSVEELFNYIKDKNSTISVYDEFEKLGFNIPIASVLTKEEMQFMESNLSEDEKKLNLNRASKLAIYAAEKAIQNSGFNLNEKSRKGLFLGSNKSFINLDDLQNINDVTDDDFETVDYNSFIKKINDKSIEKESRDQDEATLLLSEKYNFQDMVYTHGDACAAGSISIGTAYRNIKHDELDIALVGASETMANPIGYYLFNLLNALYSGTLNDKKPEECSRPFDKERSGLVMGEGSAFLVIESEEHALKRNAEILCEIKGFYKTAEAIKITASETDGSEYARCMKGALEDAGLIPDQIENINAHGTSTPLNDLCEARAIYDLFGDNSSVTSNKSAIGHTFGASGVIEAALSVMSLVNQELLPTLNFKSAKPDEPELDIVTEKRKTAISNILSNSFVFGGVNSSIIFGLN